MDSNVATVTITVNPVNDTPVAVDDAYNVDEDNTLNVAAPGVLDNDSDVDGDSLTAVLDIGPSNGVLALNAGGGFTYTPAANFNGSDSFTYKANDGTADSNVATVTIMVNPANDAPVADDQSVTTKEDTPVAITLTASDPDGDALTYTVVSGPEHGTLNGTTPKVTYTPDPAYTGSDSFTFKVNDRTVESNVATVSISVTKRGCGAAPMYRDGVGNSSISAADSFGNAFLPLLLALLSLSLWVVIKRKKKA